MISSNNTGNSIKRVSAPPSGGGALLSPRQKCFHLGSSPLDPAYSLGSSFSRRLRHNHGRVRRRSSAYTATSPGQQLPDRTYSNKPTPHDTRTHPDDSPPARQSDPSGHSSTTRANPENLRALRLPPPPHPELNHLPHAQRQAASSSSSGHNSLEDTGGSRRHDNLEKKHTHACARHSFLPSPTTCLLKLHPFCDTLGRGGQDLALSLAHG